MLAFIAGLGTFSLAGTSLKNGCPFSVPVSWDVLLQRRWYGVEAVEGAGVGHKARPLLLEDVPGGATA